VIKDILELEDVCDQAYRLHLDFARNRFFWDANKRTGLLMLNGHS
jgi:prophage maintenance system killer protein